MQWLYPIKNDEHIHFSWLTPLVNHPHLLGPQVSFQRDRRGAQDGCSWGSQPAEASELPYFLFLNDAQW